MEIANSYSVGTITVGEGSEDYGGLIGYVVISANDIINCAWLVGTSDNAIGDDGDGNPIALLTTGGMGTDETDNTLLYEKEHPVYDQGNPDEWDF
jgi:hypothetical protein